MDIIIFFTLSLLFILISISVEDLRTMLISEKKLIILTALGLAYLIYLGLSSEKVNINILIMKNSFSMLIIFIILYLISNLSYKIIGVNSLGIGDIKLFSISTLWLGLELSLISIFISFLLSAIYSIYGKIFKRFKPFKQYPFAPFVSIGIFSSWIIDKI
tara:strand:- start:6 stop:485 length:480 start_codon:yes stop_codon:yes gene_type:complete